MPTEWIHAPWEAPPLDLEAAGVTLGRDYPERIVDHAAAREEFLAVYKEAAAAPEAPAGAEPAEASAD